MRTASNIKGESLQSNTHVQNVIAMRDKNLQVMEHVKIVPITRDKEVTEDPVPVLIVAVF